MQAASVFKVHDQVEWVDVEDEIVIVNPENGILFSLKHTAADIWRLCMQSKTLQEIYSDLGLKYGIPDDQAGTDVGEFLSSLSEKNLLIIGE